MKLNKPFRLDGVPHDADSLGEFCRRQLEREGIPDWKKEIFSFLQEWLDPARETLQQYTSGTTGPARKIPLVRDSMIRSAEITLSFFGLAPGARILLCLPVRYIAGKMMVVRALVGGLDLVTVEPSGRPLQEVSHPVDFAAMVPMQVYNTLRDGGDLSLAGKLLIGGGEIHPALRERLTGMKIPEVYESFGMTETYTHLALKKINGGDPDPQFRTLEGVKVSLDERGCLVVEMDGVARDPVVTNDLVELAPDKKSFRWLGRADHLISTGGIKVIPEMLEEKIRNLLGIDCLVIPEPDEQLGQRLVLMVEYAEPDPPVERWIQSLKEMLEAHEIPKMILTVTQIPRNASFKPDRLSASRLLKFS